MLAMALREDPSVTLATDLYELSMAKGYWRNEVADLEASFALTFRRNPFEGGYVVAAGLADAVALLREFRFSRSDLDYLATLTDRRGGRMFEDAFLRYLEALELRCDVQAVPEGTVVFPHEPLLRVQGPILQAQVLETVLLNVINFQSLIATKAARICHAAQGDPVVDFGLRRAQGLDGGYSAARAASIGGCVGTSNMLAGKLLGIPVLGTFAHSWVMSFDSEQEAFDAFARSMPDNCVFLVDTYGSVGGVHHAVETGRRLREAGHEMVGVRLDSGDLAYLSAQARRILDEAGFPEAQVMASSELDEHIIRSLKLQGARINAWGVGTRLVTAYDDPALGGVYKLTAVRPRGEPTWRYKLKLSEQKDKINVPGVQQVYRYTDGDGKFIADAICEQGQRPEAIDHIVDPNDNTKRKRLRGTAAAEPLLVPVFEQGRAVYESPALPEIRERVQRQLACLDAAHKRFENPHIYPAGLSPQLNRIRDDMITRERALLENGNAMPAG